MTEKIFKGNRALTTEEIMEKCPEEIKLTKDVLKPKRGRKPRHGTGKLRWHSEEDRIRCATIYAATGSAVETSKITGIPSGTIRQWRTQDWWPQVIERIQQEADDELDVRFTKIVRKSIDEIEDRLENGNFIHDKKTGSTIRVPPTLKELGVNTSIFMDKRDLIRRKAKTAVEQASTKEILNQIAESVRKLAQETKGRTLEGEIIDVVGAEEVSTRRVEQIRAEAMGATGVQGTSVQAERTDEKGKLPSGDSGKGS